MNANGFTWRCSKPAELPSPSKIFAKSGDSGMGKLTAPGVPCR